MRYAPTSPARAQGYSVQQEEALNYREIARNKNLAQQKQRSLSGKKYDARMRGEVPRSLHQLRINQTKDPEYWSRDPEAALRAEGLLYTEK